MLYRSWLAAAGAVVLAGCTSPVLQQRVPVASDPPGATARDDSGASCITPCALDLDRNRDHIVSVMLAGYHPQDIVVSRQYRTADVLLTALNSGLSSARVHNNADWALRSGMNSKAAQEASGAAYTLEPSVIRVQLQPSHGAAISSTSQTGTPPVAIPEPARVPEASAAEGLALMDNLDRSRLQSALEEADSGVPTAWSNPHTGARFTVVSDPVILQDGQVLRPFTLSVNRAGNLSSLRYQALRLGRGHWQILSSHDAPPAIR